jgi:hypothetical protein
MQVDNLMMNYGSSVYYTDDLRNVLEDFMTYFRTNPTTQTMTVDPGDAVRYESDFYALLTYLNIAPQYHFPILRINNMTASTDYRSTMTSFLVPDLGEVQRIAQTEQTSTSALT